MGQPYPKVLNHRSLFSAGGVRTKVKNGQDQATRILASLHQGREERDVVWSRSLPGWKGGKIVYVRGTNSSTFDGGRLLTPDDPEKYFIGQLHLRYALDQFGMHFGIKKKDPAVKSPVVTVSRSNNAFIFSGYSPNTTATHVLKFPQGAPLLLGFQTDLNNGHSTYTMPTAWSRECRVFVEQMNGELSYKELHSGQNGITKRFFVGGLKEATVRIYPESHVTQQSINVYLNARYPWKEGKISVARGDENFGYCFEVKNVTGDLVVSW
jgi:hypothetical protein